MYIESVVSGVDGAYKLRAVRETERASSASLITNTLKEIYGRNLQNKDDESIEGGDSST